MGKQLAGNKKETAVEQTMFHIPKVKKFHGGDNNKNC